MNNIDLVQHLEELVSPVHIVKHNGEIVYSSTINKADNELLYDNLLRQQFMDYLFRLDEPLYLTPKRRYAGLLFSNGDYLLVGPVMWIHAPKLSATATQRPESEWGNLLESKHVYAGHYGNGNVHTIIRPEYAQGLYDHQGLDSSAYLNWAGNVKQHMVTGAELIRVKFELCLKPGNGWQESVYSNIGHEAKLAWLTRSRKNKAKLSQSFISALNGLDGAGAAMISGGWGETTKSNNGASLRGVSSYATVKSPFKSSFADGPAGAADPKNDPADMLSYSDWIHSSADGKLSLGLDQSFNTYTGHKKAATPTLIGGGVGSVGGASGSGSVSNSASISHSVVDAISGALSGSESSEGLSQAGAKAKVSALGGTDGVGLVAGDAGGSGSMEAGAIKDGVGSANGDGAAKGDNEDDAFADIDADTLERMKFTPTDTFSEMAKYGLNRINRSDDAKNYRYFTPKKVEKPEPRPANLPLSLEALAAGNVFNLGKGEHHGHKFKKDRKISQREVERKAKFMEESLSGGRRLGNTPEQEAEVVAKLVVSLVPWIAYLTSQVTANVDWQWTGMRGLADMEGVAGYGSNSEFLDKWGLQDCLAYKVTSCVQEIDPDWNADTKLADGERADNLGGGTKLSSSSAKANAQSIATPSSMTQNQSRGASQVRSQSEAQMHSRGQSVAQNQADDPSQGRYQVRGVSLGSAQGQSLNDSHGKSLEPLAWQPFEILPVVPQSESKQSTQTAKVAQSAESAKTAQATHNAKPANNAKAKSLLLQYDISDIYEQAWYFLAEEAAFEQGEMDELYTIDAQAYNMRKFPSVADMGATEVMRALGVGSSVLAEHGYEEVLAKHKLAGKAPDRVNRDMARILDLDSERAAKFDPDFEADGDLDSVQASTAQGSHAPSGSSEQSAVEAHAVLWSDQGLKSGTEAGSGEGTEAVAVLETGEALGAKAKTGADAESQAYRVPDLQGVKSAEAMSSQAQSRNREIASERCVVSSSSISDEAQVGVTTSCVGAWDDSGRQSTRRGRGMRWEQSASHRLADMAAADFDDEDMDEYERAERRKPISMQRLAEKGLSPLISTKRTEGVSSNGAKNEVVELDDSVIAERIKGINVLLKTYFEVSRAVSEDNTPIDRAALQEFLSHSVTQNKNLSINDVLATETPHNAYSYELNHLQAVTDGEPEKALRALRSPMHGEEGRMGFTPLRHAKNSAIINATLDARAAIRGGVRVETAYTMADYMILMSELCQTEDEAIKLREECTYRFAELVKQSKQKKNLNYSVLVNKILEEIDRSIFVKVNREDLVRCVGRNEDYVQRVFKVEVGESLMEHLRRLRIERAKDLIANSEVKISELAELFQFSSTSHFARVFKKFTGVSPAEYKAKFYKKQMQQK